MNSKNLNSQKNVANLLTNTDVEDEMFSKFKSDKERIRYMSQAYKNMSLAKAFSVYYDVPI